MTETNLSAADLTLRDLSVLAKRFLVTMITCAILFVPFYLLMRGSVSFATDRFGEEVTSAWVAWIVGAIFLVLIVANLSDFLQNLSEFFGDCARLTKGLSLTKRVFVLVLSLLYLLAWQHLPDFAFFIFVLVLLPAAATFDKYQDILREKHSARAQAG